ncbi:10704_t:CDS:2, partial [Gigaspora margarita]
CDDDNLFVYKELLDKSIVKKLQYARKAAKRIPTLYTFWNQKKSVEEASKIELNDEEEQLEKVDEDDNIGELLEDEIEISLFAFNNATSYAAFSHNALITKYLNLSFTKKQEKMHSISYFYDGEKHNQNMVFPSNYHIPELRDKAKGLKEVLRERGLWQKME